MKSTCATADNGATRDGNRATIKKVNAGKNIRLLAEDEGLTLPTPVEIKFTPNGANCTVMISIEQAADARRGGRLSPRLGRGAGPAQGLDRKTLNWG